MDCTHSTNMVFRLKVVTPMVKKGRSLNAPPSRAQAHQRSRGSQFLGHDLNHDVAVTLPPIVGHFDLSEPQVLQDCPNFRDRVAIDVELPLSVLAAENHR